MRLLKTPNSNNSLRGRLRPERLDGPRHDLGDQIAGLIEARATGKLLPTPTVADARNGRSIRQMTASAMERGASKGVNLTHLAEHEEVSRFHGFSREDFGPYGSSVQHWADVVGRQPPPPVIDEGKGLRLSPKFVEWMMGLEEGLVTDSGVSRSQQLKILGNGVVPQQAALALEILDPDPELEPVARRRS